MKKLTYMLAAGSLFIAATALLSRPATAAEETPRVPSVELTITTPDIPDKIEFCGKTISLDRDDMYERYDRELTSMAYTHGNTMLVLKRANRYFPIMAPILKEEGVPLDMLYLACIESQLNNRARSGASAAGLWQFMPATGKEYGLEVNDSVDERYNTELATRAACRFLKKAYARYGDWPTVAAAYNGGTNRISRELSAQQADRALDLYLNDETSRYPFRIMAMKAIMEHPSHYGFKLRADQLYMPVECDTILVDKPLASWAAWAKEHGTDYLSLREMNPWIRGKSLPNKSGKVYSVAVPKKDALLRSHREMKVFNPNWTK
ncbi:MAG: lytic transglycosylase domain-containing protein [Muribaculaceae bacterium]|nr:lytic transglycosylase domain-containing protein [Muribaculaceae bacterium]